jgi:predicted nucleotide-binding protein (sugar kinase/HSP70/actin superfamily)
MDVIVGTGPVHDALFAAALRAQGRAAQPCGGVTDAALSLGRALLPRGHPCSVYYLAGAMVLHARARPGALRFVTPGDRCGGYATDLRAALVTAGLDRCAVWAPSPERDGAPGERSGALRRDLVRALCAGDVLRSAAQAARGGSPAPERVEAWLAEATEVVAGALEHGRDVAHALASRFEGLRALPPTRRPRCTVRITGELLPTAYPGDPGGSLVRWLEALGARVESPTLGEWWLYHAWRASPQGSTHGALRRTFARARGRYARALGVRARAPVDALGYVDEARRWLPVGASAGSGFLELAVWLSVARSRSAALVVSLKPFASITSSAVSDAVLHALARGGRPGFLALELNGDVTVQHRSRLELALETFGPRHRGRHREERG